MITPAFLHRPTIPDATKNVHVGVENNEAQEEQIPANGPSALVGGRLNFGANTPHVVFLYVMDFAFVYLPTAILTKEVSSMFGVDHSEFSLWGKASIAYMVGLVLYAGFATLYYHAGHNWKLAIKSKKENKEAKSRLADVLKRLSCHSDS